METYRCVFTIIAIVLSHSFGATVERCRSPQYLELGKTQEIQCHFQHGFYAVAWYASHDYTEVMSLIRFVNGFKQGNGYTSGEYDIQMDGSLIINNVTLQHDHRFTVLKFQSQDDDPLIFVVEAIVTVKPVVNFPVIDLCEEKPSCFLQLNPGTNVTCFVRGARPGVSLTWVERIDGEDRKVLFDTFVIYNSTMTSKATTSSTFSHSSLLSLLVCKAATSPGILLQQESIIFVENSHIDFSNVSALTVYVERESLLQLSCSETNASLIVWKMTRDINDVFLTIGYATYFGSNVSKIYYDDYVLQSDGSLKLPQAETKHEGLYGCVHENKDSSGIVVYNVVVFVASSPFVHGCTLKQYCVLATQFEGNLTCSVTGIRPSVALELRTLDDRDASLIMFTDQTITTNTKGETYDVQITSKYKIQQTSRNRLTLECRILGPSVTAFSSSAKFDLLIAKVQPPTGQPTETQPTDNFIATGLTRTRIFNAIVVILLTLSLLLNLIHLLKDRKMRRKRLKRDIYQNLPLDELEEEENSYGRRRKAKSVKEDRYQSSLIPMDKFGEKEYSYAKKNVFISELRAKYQNLYNAVQPIPYVRDRLHCVQRVFVEGGMEYLVAKEKICGHGSWEKLPSHHCVLSDPRLKSKRRILEGEPGYGKSTFTLQLAYDWCNKIVDSYLKNIEILIILRLRQFRGMRSIFDAIKQLLLPMDSILNENDVKTIILQSMSVVVVLDGFDEYPDRDGETNSDILNIIAREMFQKFEVILTTRSSCMPNNIPPLTKRIKMSGFDDAAQDRYIHKAVVGDDNEAAEKIKKQMKENPLLKDLCEAPLFFSMFAHMVHESDDFQKCSSVTGFFWHLISCLHSHMENKMKDKNVIQYDLNETDHKHLDKIAFDGLCSKGQQTVWKKDELLIRLGHDLYNQYVRIGILVEEEVLDICHTSNLQASGNIKYQTDVQFYHKVFCEWYAAHYLAEYTANREVFFEHSKYDDPKEETFSDEKDHYFKNLDPFDLQYTYRFACGLNPKASEKIVGFLKSKNETKKFAILCMLEQSSNNLQDVKDLCSRDITLSVNDSLLLQRSTVHLLKIASTNKICISSVRLTECYGTFDQANVNIHLKSHFTVPVLTTLRKLCIEETGTQMSVNSLSGIVKYSSMCPALEELWFYHCLLPRCMPIESLSDAKPRNGEVKKKQFLVFWGTGISTYYCLNLTSGLWQRPPQYGSVVINDEDYKRAVENVKQRVEKMS